MNVVLPTLRGHGCLRLDSPRSGTKHQVHVCLFGMCGRHRKESKEEMLSSQNYPTQWAGGLYPTLKGHFLKDGLGEASDTYFPSTSTLLPVYPVARFRALSGTRSHQTGGWHWENLTRVHWTSKVHRVWAKELTTSATVTKQTRFCLSVCWRDKEKRDKKPSILVS